MKHKYLEEVGIKEYPDNNWGNKMNPIKKIKNFSKKRKTGINHQDLYDLDVVFYQWVYEHLCYFIDTTEDKVDLTYHTFTYKKKTYNQLEFMEYLKSLILEYLNFDEFQDMKDFNFTMEKTDDGYYTVVDNRTEREKEEYIFKHKENLKKQRDLSKDIFKVFEKLLPYLWW